MAVACGKVASVSSEAASDAPDASEIDATDTNACAPRELDGSFGLGGGAMCSSGTAWVSPCGLPDGATDCNFDVDCSKVCGTGNTCFRFGEWCSDGGKVIPDGGPVTFLCGFCQG